MKRGFTLVELLTVIAIIGILSTVVIISTSRARIDARDAKRKSDLNSVSTALEMYYARQRQYPVVGNGWSPISAISATLGDFLSAMPTDPKNSGSFVYEYCADSTASATKYVLDVALEGDEQPTNPTFAGDSGGNGCQGSTASFFTGSYKDSSDDLIHYRVTNK